MIIQFILISIIIIIWLQYPLIKEVDEKSNKYIKTFDIIKIPITVICLFFIIYIYVTNAKNPLQYSLKAYTSIPKF
jgi:hypothetical protein